MLGNLLEPTHYGVPPTSYGPVVDPDGPGGDPPVIGVALTSEPQAFLVDLNQLSADQFAQQVAINTRLFVFTQTGDQGGEPTDPPGPVDRSNVWNLAMGYFRTGADADSLMSASFAIDDIALLDALPEIRKVGTPDTLMTEGGSPISLNFELTAMPVDDVIVDFVVNDPSEGRLSQDRVVITPDSWSGSRTVLLIPVDDSFRDGHQPVRVDVELRSRDPLYNNTNPDGADLVWNATNRDNTSDSDFGEDVIIDDFEDGNFVLEDWDNGAWVTFDGGTSPEGHMTATRTNSNSILAVSRKDASIETGAGGSGFAYQGGPDAVIPSDPATVDDQYQALSLTAIRPDGFDASGVNYLRFRAWATAPVPAGSKLFAAISGNPLEPTYFGFPPTSFAPGDDDEYGFELSAEPTDYLVPLSDLRPDPLVDRLALNNRRFVWADQGSVGPEPDRLPGPANTADIWALAIGLHRRGSDADSLMNATFRIDNVGFLVNEPAILTSRDSITTTEGGAPTTADITLAAAPSHDVVVHLRSERPGEVVTSPATMTFTPANWDQPQELTLTPADDDFIEPDPPLFYIEARAASEDGLYAALGEWSDLILMAQFDDGGDSTTVDDLLLDDFEDSNFVMENWDGATWVTFDGGANPEGLMTAGRANPSNILAVSRKDASLQPGNGGTTFQAGPDSILASDASDAALRYQSLSLSAIRPTGFDLARYRYLRFRAWDTATPPAGSEFVLSLAGNPLEPTFNGFPPLSSSAVDVLTAGPRDFIIDLQELGTNDVLQQLGLNNRRFVWDQGGQVGPEPSITPGAVALGDVWSLGFGYERFGDDADSLMSTTFRVDDIGIMQQAPGVTVWPELAILRETGGDPVTATYVLNARPVRDVYITLWVTDPSEASLSTNLLTFTPSNWNVPQEVILDSVQDMIDDGDRLFEVRGDLSSADQLYNEEFYDSEIAPFVPIIEGLNRDDTDTTVLDGALVDNFNDNDFTAQPWDGVWIAFDNQPNPVGQATAARTNSNGILATSRRPATLQDDGEGGWEYHMDAATILGSDPLNSDPDVRFQSLSLGLIRTSTFDATPFRYLRFRAWNTEPAPTGATFAIAATQSPLEPTFYGVPPTSYGPWDGTDPQADLGLDLTSSPIDYIVDLETFRTDPLAATVGLTTRQYFWDQNGQTGPAPSAPGPVAWGDLWTLNFGYQRRGADAAVNMTAGFAIDDIQFVAMLPGITVDGAPASLWEPEPAEDITVVLDSPPVRPVTLNLSTSSPTQATITPASLTFTTENWNTPQTAQFQAVDDAVVDGDVMVDLVIEVSDSDDQLFAALPAETFTVLVRDNDSISHVFVPIADPLVVPETGTAVITVRLTGPPSSNVQMLAATFGDPGMTVTGGGTHTFTLANWHIPVSVFVSAARDADYENGTGTLLFQFTGGLNSTGAVTLQEQDFVPSSGTITR